MKPQRDDDDDDDYDNTRTFSDDERKIAKGELPVGTLAGEYRVGEIIARGGCGAVYHAAHTATGARVAVKVLHAALASQPKMVERFSREVRVVNLLRHPNIVEIYEVGSLPDGRPFYAMEYIEGRTLSELLEERRRFPAAEALDLLEPVCAALQAAHAAGIVHRDVKASNIAITGGPNGVVKLLDFGIAKLLGPSDTPGGFTSVGRQVGTLAIMAPEQLTGGPIDARVDVYALGVLICRMLTGRLPFEAKSPFALAQQHLEEPAPRPSTRLPIAPAFDAIVLRCLEKRPERRYPSVTELLAALRKAVGRPAEDAPRPDQRSRGVALYVELLVRSGDDELDDDLSDDVGSILAFAEERIHEAKLGLAAVTGNAVLGMSALPADRAAALDARQAAVEMALALRDDVDQRPGADPRVHINISVHVDEIVTREDGAEITGGALLRTERWSAREPSKRVCVTPAVIEGVQRLDVSAGPGDLLDDHAPLAGLTVSPAGDGCARLVNMVAARREPVPYPEHTQAPILIASEMASSYHPRHLAESARARILRFQAERPGDFAAIGMTLEEAARVEAEGFLEHARSLDRKAPGYLASLGTTPEEYATGMLEPGLTIDESVAAGLMHPAEGRYIQGSATRQDLIELAYPSEEIDAILEDQRARACASSS